MKKALIIGAAISGIGAARLLNKYGYRVYLTDAKEIKERKERLARNPRTGESVKVDAGIKPVFEASRELTKLLNDVVSDVIPEEMTTRTDG